MREGWLFDPGRPKPVEAADPLVVADAGREAEAEPRPSLEDDVTSLLFALFARRYAVALDILADLEPALQGDALGHVARGWAYGGLGRLAEAEEQLLRAEVHAARSLWRVDNLLLRAREAIAAARTEAARAKKARRRKAAERRPPTARPAAQPPAPTLAPGLPTPEVRLQFSLERRPPPSDGAHDAVDAATAFEDYRLREAAVAVDQLRRYDTLLSLGVARGVDHYEYQLRTVRRVLRDFRGRALLADEVGLGKTIEAALCLEEYLQRGLAHRILLLVPPGLLGQWRDELLGKFDREAFVATGARARKDPGLWERERLVLTSMALARTAPHAERIVEAGFDMVVVDEAHRLKNRRTLLWRLVDRLRARYLLLLSATPVENDLVEIYNVLSLLRPGLFSTQAEFKRRFVVRGKRTPTDPAGLRALLKQVMIRNTRAVAEAKLPPRFAATLRATPTPEESAFRRRLDREVRSRLTERTLSRLRAGEILRAAGARPPVAAKSIERHLGADLAGEARRLGSPSKDAVLADLLGRRRDDKVIVFATNRDTVTHVHDVAASAGRSPVIFHGSMSPSEKTSAVETFRDVADVLVATDSGGEGFNLHFARTVVNYDLPWNPMRIEQRIGRVHRIGQERDVFVFNLVAAGTIEEEVLRVLDEKIDMFELVVGEVEGILGRLGDDEREFSDLVLDIYAEAADAQDMRARFDALADRMVTARKRHLKVVAIDDEVFGRELEA